MNLLDFPISTLAFAFSPVFSHVSSGMRKSERTSVCNFVAPLHLPMEIPNVFLLFHNFSIII